MADHTPGPWEYREPGGEEVFGPAIYAPGAHDTDPLAAAKTEADARLIAAAPDLLAALQGVAGFAHAMAEHDRKYDTLGFMVNCPDKRCIAARAAIAKATEPIVAAV